MKRIRSNGLIREVTFCKVSLVYRHAAGIDRMFYSDPMRRLEREIKPLYIYIKSGRKSLFAAPVGTTHRHIEQGFLAFAGGHEGGKVADISLYQRDIP